MFDKLQKKWKVGGWQVLIILIIFALGGSVTGFLGRKLMGVFEIELIVLYIIVYAILITIILAPGCFGGQHTIWTVFIFQKLHCQDR